MKKINALLLLVVIVAACKDDDPKLTVEQYLTAPTNGWVFETLMITVPGSTLEVNAMTTPPFSEGYDDACEKDDATIFATDGKYTVANNTKCEDTEGDPVDTGTWTLSSDKTSLTIDSNDDVAFTVTKLAIDDTHISGEIDNFLGLGIHAKVTLARK